MGRALGLALLVASAALGGCAQTGFRPAAPSARAVFLELPALSQEEAGRCGLVSLEILCTFHGVAVPEEDHLRLAQAVREQGGVSGAELQAVLRELGMGAALFQGSLGDAPTGLRRHVDAGRPVLAMISLDGEAHHYCLVNGYEPEGDVPYVLDPRRGQVAVGTERFDSLWARSRRFTLVAAPGLVAAASDPELEALHAGDITLSDRDLKIIGLTALAILILVLVL